MSGDAAITQEQTINERVIREPMPLQFFTGEGKAVVRKSAQPVVVQGGYICMGRIFRHTTTSDMKPFTHSLSVTATFPTDDKYFFLFDYTKSEEELEKASHMYVQRQYKAVGVFLFGSSTSNDGMNVTNKRNGYMNFRNTGRKPFEGGDKVYALFPAYIVADPDSKSKPMTAVRAFGAPKSMLTAYETSGDIDWAPMITVGEEDYEQFVKYHLQTYVSPVNWAVVRTELDMQCFVGTCERACTPGNNGAINWRDP
jgi:hypothetical protein